MDAFRELRVDLRENNNQLREGLRKDVDWLFRGQPRDTTHQPTTADRAAALRDDMKRANRQILLDLAERLKTVTGKAERRALIADATGAKKANRAAYEQARRELYAAADTTTGG